MAVLTVAFVLASAAYGLAQRGSRNISATLAPDPMPDGDFVICRLAYPEGQRFVQGWQTDFPLGERNLSIRFSELTRTRVSRGRGQTPNHYVVRLTDDSLFACPLLMAGDVGSMELSAADAARFREYLLKGGFIWTDDMWGDEEWEVWKSELAKVLPPAEYPWETITPADPIFTAQFVVSEMPQVPNIGYWRRSGGDTSEMGSVTATPYFHVVRDHDGRVMVASTRNTDIADAFEREGDDPEYFAQFAPKGYALGINLLLHVLTH